MNSLKKGLLKVLADAFCLFVFVIPLWVYNLLDVVPLTRLGFFCNDDGIRYPYHPSSVSSAAMMVSGFVIMLMLGLFVEIFLLQRNKHLSVPTQPFHPLVVAIYRLAGYFIVGASINQFLTDVGKQAVGRPRPHFIDVCQPSVVCTDANRHVYIENYTCLRTSHPLIPAHDFTKRILDARKSFPSGHASFSLYVTVFMVIYLEFRMRSQNTRIVRHLVQAGIMAWGLWICCTRITDFKHRYSDVAAGILLGSAVASFTAYLYIRSCNSKIRKAHFIDPESNIGTCGQNGLHNPADHSTSLGNHLDTALTGLEENRE
ncbi:phospholipid phosphatase 2-like [Clavelina lepadiformis]|uniref:Phosphatidic acid phosphatase type 2/haloperoxidase domain-containing protein n=1 Tax=Clavelina lepadiformis TaxID=159417 RepID=A0ABP0FQK9_CLALP